MPKFPRRTVNMAVRQRVVTRIAVRTRVAEVRHKRKLPPTPNIRFDMKKEAAVIRTQSLEKGNWSVGRNTQGHEETTVPRVQHDVLGFRNARDCGNSSMFMEISHPARVFWSFVRFNPSQQGSPNGVCRSSWSGRRGTGSRGRKTHGGADVRGSRVLQDRSQDHAQNVEMSARLAALVPISLAEALSAASMGGDGERAHGSGTGVAGVFETWRVDTTPQSGLDWGEERGPGQLEPGRVSAGEKPPDKNWGLGRHSPPGLRKAELDDPAKAIS